MATAIKSILPTVPDTPVETLSRQLSVADVDISAGGAAGLGVPAPSRSHHPSNAGRDGSPISLNVAGPLDTSLRPSFRASSRKSGPDMDRRRSVGPPSGTASSASIHIPQSALSSQPTMPYPNTPPPRSNQMTMEDIFKRPTYTPPSNNNNTLSNGGSLLPVLGKLGTGNGNWQANTVTLSPPHPSITVGSTTASPWWMSNKISPSTRSENDYLAELLHLMRRQAGGATGGSIAGSSKLSGPASNNLVDYIEVKNGQGVFEKNFYEIQRLLERAKNSEDRSHLNSPLNDNATDRKKKIEKESNDSSNAAAAAAAAAAYSTADYDSYNNNSAAAAASSAMGNILGRGSHDVGLMRKPLRLILADLNKRIELLKTNQAEWEAFQLKIATIKNEESKRAREGANIVRRNKAGIMEIYTKEKKLEAIQILKENHDTQRILVRKKKRALVSADLKRRMAVIQKKEDETMESQRTREKEKMGKAKLTQTRWFMIVVMASRVNRMRHLLEEARKEKSTMLVYVHAARVIQKAWKRYTKLIWEQRIKGSLEIISRCVRGYILMKRQINMDIASNKIRQFFKDVHDVSKLTKVVKKYRFSVMHGQRICRMWIEVKHTRIKIISGHWDKLLPEWWANRKQINSTATASEFAEKADEGDRAKGSKKGDKAKGGKAVKSGAKDDGFTEKVVVKIAPQIKLTVINDDYVIRRKAYRKAVHAWELSKTTAATKKRGVGFSPGKQMEEKKPIWRMLPSNADMMALLEKGFMIQAQQMNGGGPSKK